MEFFVYILANKSGNLYIGQTCNLSVRIREHKTTKGSKFARDVPGLELVYFEKYPLRIEAVKRENQLKGWSREKKKALIEGNFARLRELSRGKS